MAQRRTNRRRRLSPAVPLVLLALLVLVYLYRSGTVAQLLERPGFPRGPAGGGALADGASAAGDIRVFFTTPSLVYPDTPARRPRSPLLSAVLADLDAARTSVDLASFDFDIVEVTDALIRAQQRGVSVRAIVDSENLDTPEVSEQTGRLQTAGIPIHFDHREPFMHDKFIVVDSAVIWTGSWNVTTNDTWRNNNQMLRFTSLQIAADYTHEFEQMFAGRFGTSKTSGTPYPRVRIGRRTWRSIFRPRTAWRSMCCNV